VVETSEDLNYIALDPVESSVEKQLSLIQPVLKCQTLVMTSSKRLVGLIQV